MCLYLAWVEWFGFLLVRYRWTDKRAYRHTAQIIIYIYPTSGTKFCQIVHSKLLASTSGTQVLSTYTISHVVRREVENCRNEAINKNLFSTPVRHYGAQTWHFPLTCNFYAVRAKVHL